MTSAPPPAAAAADEAAAEPDHPPWPGWMAPAALVAGLGVTLLAGIVVLIVAAAAGSHGRSTPAQNIAGTFLQDAGFVAVALLFARSGGGRLRPRDFGLVGARVGQALKWGVLGAIGYAVFAQVWTKALDLHAKDNLPEQLGADRGTVALVTVAVLVCVIAPLAEEFFFRGFFFTALRNWKGPVVAAVITGVVFGAAHVVGTPIGFLVPLAVFGFVLCLMRWRTGSLYPGIVLHALNNGYAFGVLEHWSPLGVALSAVGSVAAVTAVMVPVTRTFGRLTAGSRTIRA